MHIGISNESNQIDFLQIVLVLWLSLVCFDVKIHENTLLIRESILIDSSYHLSCVRFVSFHSIPFKETEKKEFQ